MEASEPGYTEEEHSTDSISRPALINSPIVPHSDNTNSSIPLHDDSSNLAASLLTASETRRPSDSLASRVNINFQNPTGVQEALRSMTQIPAHNEKSGEPTSDTDSELTLPVGDEPFDLEKTLGNVIRKRDKANVPTRELGVMFRNLRVTGLGASTSFQPTLGSVLNPMNVVHAVQDIRHPPVRDILSGFEGVVRPGEMLLVLGRPGSGCTTFLKTIANHRAEYHSVEGQVHYDSLTPEEMFKHYRGDISYCPEDDVHFAPLTVEQTLRFAAKTRIPQNNFLSNPRSALISICSDLTTTLLGLKHARKTRVGDAAIRGVSGGEKKRVSIGEVLVTRSRLAAWDNSTRGLDASTALEFGKILRTTTDMDRVTTVVSLYQAGETLYQVFDKVCIIYEGQMAYFGPANQARQYFIDMGYEPANRQTTADFLVAVTDPNGRIPRPDVSAIPRSAEEFAEYFKSSPIGQLNRTDVERYQAEFVGSPERAAAYKESVLFEHAKNVRKGSPYIVSVPMQVAAVMTRRVQILQGDFLAFAINLISFIIQGIIIGTVFLKVSDSTAAFFSRGGVLFFALLFSALSSMAEIPSLYAQRPILHKHQQAALYHPFIEALAFTLVDIPITFAITIVFAIIIYFLVGLQQSAEQFFVFYLFLFTMSVTMKAWFRAIAAAFKSESTAQSVSGIVLLVLVVYTGFAIPVPSMIGALKWISYINPLRYGFEGILANELRTLNATCASLVPQGPGYENVTLANQVCTSVGSEPANAFVSGSKFLELSYGYSYSHEWRNFGIVAAFGIAFLATYLFFTEFNTTLSGETAIVYFKRGSKSAAESRPSGSDEEKGTVVSPATSSNVSQEKKALAEVPLMSEVFSWQHIRYSVPVGRHETRQLLDDVSGYVIPGKLTALMGESGAGKTTLLNVLAQRVDVGVVTGDRFVNGQALPEDFQAQTGYCQQADTHLPTATVREALLFSANMRQPASVPLAEKAAYVEKCITMCGLEAYADAIVGSLGTEYRKRTTIGVELAAKPKLLLFLDEPTSGLDSQSAWGVVSFLRSLADSGQAILCTIHQPSAELFQVFDRLLLLRKGGQTVFFGDIGDKATNVIRYFERNGSRACEEGENPAEFMLDVIGAGATATSEQDWYDIWRRSPENQSVQNQIDAIHVEGRNRPVVEATLHSEFATSWTYQTIELIKRGTRNNWRDPTYLVAKLILNIAAGLFIGFTFFKSKNTQQGTQNKLFAIFMGAIVSVPLSNQLQVPFLNTRAIYEIRERPSRMYSWTALITSQILAELPWNILGSSLFFFCWYWTVGFPEARAGYTYLLLCIIFPLYYTTIAQAVAAMAPNAEIAAILFGFLFSFVLTFNGVLQPFRQLGWWRWMYHLSPYTYLIEGLLGQAFGRQEMQCAPVEFVTLQPPSGQTCGSYMEKFISSSGGYLTNPDASSSCQFCSFANTDDFLAQSFNIYYSHHWRNVGFMLAYVVFNVFCIYYFTYIFRVHKGPLLGSLRRRFTRKSQ